MICSINENNLVFLLTKKGGDIIVRMLLLEYDILINDLIIKAYEVALTDCAQESFKINKKEYRL
jgi:hypothetical protein